MGIFSWSPRNSRRIFNLAHFPSHEDVVNPSSSEAAHENRSPETSPMKRKLRASVRCINFVRLLEARMTARRRFRAAVHAVMLTNSLSERIAARRKLRAALQIIILSDRVVNRPLDRRFNLEDFQDAVNLVVAKNRLDRQCQEKTHETGMKKLNYAMDKVLQGVSPKLVKPKVMEVKGKLVHKTTERFTTIWKFEEDKPAPNAVWKYEEEKPAPNAE